MSLIKYIKEIRYTLTTGVTKPVRAVLDDDQEVIAKLFNNSEGNRTLVNEMVSHKIASLLKLPIVESGICYLDSSTTINNCNATYENYGPCFYSKYLPKSTTLKLGIMRLLENIDDFYKLLLFDHIIYNKDRNIFNLLVTYTKSDIRFKLIDHSHVLKNEAIWDVNCFRQGISDFDVKDTHILSSNDDLYSLFYRSMNFNKEKLYSLTPFFKENITHIQLNNFLKELPEEWEVSSDEKDALCKYILYRTSNVELLCDIICKNMLKT